MSYGLGNCRKQIGSLTAPLLAKLTILLAGIGLLPTTYAFTGLDPAKAITQYTQRSWGTDAGLPHNSVTAIAQTPDGYLWLGTEEGLARFDGVRFTVFNKENTPSLQSNRILALLVDSRGSLWIGTGGGGLTHLAGNQFTSYSTRNGLSNDAVLCLYEDRKGALWIGTDGGGLNRFRNGRFQTYTSPEGFPSDAIFAVTGAGDGSLWIGTHDGLVHMENSHIHVYTKRDGLADNYVKAVRVGQNGDVWVGTNGAGLSHLVNGRFSNYTTRDGLSSNSIWSIFQDGRGTLWVGTIDAGLNRFHDGTFNRYTARDGLPFNRVLAFFEDREGNFWIGTGGAGLVRLQNGSFTSVGSGEGLSNDVVLPVFQDREGAIWIGTNGSGLNRLKDGRITKYSTHNGLSDDVVLSLAGSSDGSLWIGTRKGINRLKDRKLTLFTTKDGLPSNIVLSLYQDREGTLWAGSRAGLSRFDGRRFLTYTTSDGLSNNYVVSLFQTRDKTLWIGTGGGGLNRLQNGSFTSLTTRDGLSNNAVWSITGDDDGTLWIGTSGGGLNRFSDGKFTVYTARRGLFDDEIFQILSDRYGYLWMSSNKGVFRVPKWQLNAFAEGRLAQIQSTSYGLPEGLKSVECNGGFQPAGWQTAGGQLLFPTMKGMVSVDPAKLRTNAFRPPVVIERIAIDGINFESNKTVQAKPGQGQLQFEFTAPSFVSPEKIQFRYKLEGFDKDWVDAGQRRAAYYTNIPPGQYRFRVAASNSEGLSSTAGASVAVTLSPHFYQTRLFEGICILLVAGLCVAAYRLRINHLRAHEKKLLLLVDERTHALQEQVQAKDRAHVELAEAQQNLIELSRQSGMAEVATSVLHNVGNVLNSVNVGATVVYEKIRDLRFDNLSAAIKMLEAHLHDLSNFVETDPKGQRVVPYLANLSGHLQAERQRLLAELETTTSHIDHIKQIVATQQDYAKVSALIEIVSLPKLVEDAFRMVEASFERHHIDLLREFDDIPGVPAAKHKVLEILVNLLRNAKQAVIEHNGPLRQIRVCIKLAGAAKVRLVVHDTGVGLPQENLTRIFAHGFTTKQNGHGFGLHSGAIAARQMNGSLWAESDGPGCGAAFILELPLEAKTAVPETSAA